MVRLFPVLMLLLLAIVAIFQFAMPGFPDLPLADVFELAGDGGGPR